MKANQIMSQMLQIMMNVPQPARQSIESEIAKAPSFGNIRRFKAPTGLSGRNFGPWPTYDEMFDRSALDR